MRITREVALTEVYLDEQARYAAVWDRTPAKVWASELAKALVWFVGVVLVLVLMLLLAPESKADSVPVGSVVSYLTQNSSLPLAGGVGKELANNLLIAQTEAWGNVWQTGSLLASENGVLKAITLYVWPGGPSAITDYCCQVVWDSSHVAIDLNLTVGLGPSVVNFGEQVVSTPEPATWIMLIIALVGALIVGNSYRKGREQL